MKNMKIMRLYTYKLEFLFKHQFQASMTKQKKNATITVLILGLLFIIFNTLWLVLYICLSYEVILINLNPNNDLLIGSLEQIFTDKSDLITILVCLLVMPLNSALNPLVYMTRNSDLIAYRRQLNARGMWRTMSSSFSRSSVSRSSRGQIVVQRDSLPPNTCNESKI